MGNHPSSLIVGWARRPSRFYPTIFPLMASPGKSQTVTGDEVSALRAGRNGLGATSLSGRRSGAVGRARAERSPAPSARLTAPSVSHCATGSLKTQAAGLTATGSLGAVDGADRLCTVTATRLVMASPNAHQVSLPRI